MKIRTPLRAKTNEQINNKRGVTIKRIGNLYGEIATFENCLRAVKNVIRHKTKANRIGGIAFTVATNPEYYAYKAYEVLLSKTFVPSIPDHFFIKEGIKQKVREIYAPKLVIDQIVHWAIIQVIGPVMLRSFYEYSCGSLPHRGPALVKKYLETELSIDSRRHIHVRSAYKYCLKLDIHHFFQSIDLDILMKLLKETFKDADLLNILQSIIYEPHTGSGLPIGYYTSQWLANFYLDKFDHWIKERLSEDFKNSIYIRYVDDLVIVASNKRKLKRIEDEISQYFKEKLNVTLKYDTYDQIFDIGKRPIDFIGYKFTYGKTTVRNSIFRNAITAESNLHKGKYTQTKLGSVISYNGWVDNAKCYTEKKRIYKFSNDVYKKEFKKTLKSRKYTAYINKLNNIHTLRTAMVNSSAENFNNGFITLTTMVKNDEGNFVMIEADRIEVT